MFIPHFFQFYKNWLVWVVEVVKGAEGGECGGGGRVWLEWGSWWNLILQIGVGGRMGSLVRIDCGAERALDGGGCGTVESGVEHMWGCGVKSRLMDCAGFTGFSLVSGSVCDGKECIGRLALRHRLLRLAFLSVDVVGMGYPGDAVGEFKGADGIVGGGWLLLLALGRDVNWWGCVSVLFLWLGGWALMVLDGGCDCCGLCGCIVYGGVSVLLRIVILVWVVRRLPVGDLERAYMSGCRAGFGCCGSCRALLSRVVLALKFYDGGWINGGVGIEFIVVMGLKGLGRYGGWVVAGSDSDVRAGVFVSVSCGWLAYRLVGSVGPSDMAGDLYVWVLTLGYKACGIVGSLCGNVYDDGKGECESKVGVEGTLCWVEEAVNERGWVLVEVDSDRRCCGMEWVERSLGSGLWVGIGSWCCNGIGSNWRVASAGVDIIGCWFDLVLRDVGEVGGVLRACVEFGWGVIVSWVQILKERVLLIGLACGLALRIGLILVTDWWRDGISWGSEMKCTDVFVESGGVLPVVFCRVGCVVCCGLSFRSMLGLVWVEDWSWEVRERDGPAGGGSCLGWGWCHMVFTKEMVKVWCGARWSVDEVRVRSGWIGGGYWMRLGGWICEEVEVVGVVLCGGSWGGLDGGVRCSGLMGEECVDHTKWELMGDARWVELFGGVRWGCGTLLMNVLVGGCGIGGLGEVVEGIVLGGGVGFLGGCGLAGEWDFIAVWRLGCTDQGWGRGVSGNGGRISMGWKIGSGCDGGSGGIICGVGRLRGMVMTYAGLVGFLNATGRDSGSVRKCGEVLRFVLFYEAGADRMLGVVLARGVVSWVCNWRGGVVCGAGVWWKSSGGLGDVVWWLVWLLWEWHVWDIGAGDSGPDWVGWVGEGVSGRGFRLSLMGGTGDIGSVVGVGLKLYCVGWGRFRVCGDGVGGGGGGVEARGLPGLVRLGMGMGLIESFVRCVGGVGFRVAEYWMLVMTGFVCWFGRRAIGACGGNLGESEDGLYVGYGGGGIGMVGGGICAWIVVWEMWTGSDAHGMV
ncbi:hypothetical protein Tco_1174529 [Tanacetum coccineum]